MNKLFNTIAIAAVIALAGCCGKAHAAQEAKLTVNSVAQAGFDNLSADQQAQILQSITAAQAKDASTIDKVDKWVNVGERIGKMVGGAAREVGVAANEFVKTDVGKMTAAMIVWNYLGSDLVHIFVHVGGGIMFIVLGLTSIFFVIRRTHPVNITYDPTVKTWLGRPQATSKSRNALSFDVALVSIIACGVTLGIGSAIMLNV